MCIDGFMFGSCCGHLSSDIFPSLTTLRPFDKPTTAENLKPTSLSNKYGAIQTIFRPNGNALIMVRKPNSGENSLTNKMTSRKPTTIHNDLNNFHDVSDVELSVGSSHVSSKYLNVVTIFVNPSRYIFSITQTPGQVTAGPSQLNPIL